MPGASMNLLGDPLDDGGIEAELQPVCLALENPPGRGAAGGDQADIPRGVVTLVHPTAAAPFEPNEFCHMGDQVILEQGLLDLAQGVAEAFGLYASPPQALAREDRDQAQPADVLQRIYRTKRVCVGEPILSYPRLHNYRTAFRRRSYASAPFA